MRLVRLFFIGILLLFSNGSHAQPSFPESPESAQIISEDLHNFLLAFEKLGPDSDSLNILQTFYFDPGSPGLEEYCTRHGLNASLLQKAIYRDPKAYEGLGAYYKRLPELQTTVLSEYRKMEQLMPAAVYPPTYLLVGANRGIAQASPEGQLVTLEKGLGSPDKLIHNMVHELVHFQQAKTLGFREYGSTYNKANNMLDLVLREGGAQYIAYELVRQNLNDYSQYQYLLASEKELWDRFQADLRKQDMSYWMWDSINQSETPILLGYAMGCRIVKAYYDKAEDKEQALRDILAISDADSFLTSSGYMELWE